MSNIDLEEILETMGENYFPMHEYPPSYEPQNVEARAKAKASIEQWYKHEMLKVIGEDEVGIMGVVDDHYEDWTTERELARNELRAEQRKAVDTFIDNIGENHGG